MIHGFFLKPISYLICVSLLLQLGGFSKISAEEKGKTIPIGEMVSRGEVQFEAKEKTWKKVELSYFPIFEGTKIRTEKGSAIISLKNDNQIEMGPGAILFFDRKDQIRLFQGRIHFRLGSPEAISINIGKITLANTPYVQAASTNRLVAKKNIAEIGTVLVDSNDSVTIRSTQGQFRVLDQQGVLLASISSKEFLKIPYRIIETPPAEKSQPMIVAQVGEIPPSQEEEGTYLGLSKWTWVGIGAGVVGVAGIALLAAGGGGGGGGGGGAPVCP
jgi:hypothetical protein